MKKYFILYLLIIVSLISCKDDEVTIRDLKLRIGLEKHNSHTVFKDIPVKFYCQLKDTTKEFPEIKLLWDLGDGSFSEERVFYHTYSQNGTYSPTLKLSDGKDEFIFDETQGMAYDMFINVNTYPRILGETDINETGVNIFSNGLDFSILYKTESIEGQKDLYIKVIDSEFNEKSTTKLSIDSSIDSIITFKSSHGSIVIINSVFFYEFSMSGSFVKQAPKAKNYYSIIPTPIGYSALSIEDNKLYSSLLNTNFELIQYNEIIIDSGSELYEYDVIDAEHCEPEVYFVLLKLLYNNSTQLLEINKKDNFIVAYELDLDNLDIVQSNSEIKSIIGKKYRNFSMYEINNNYSGYNTFYFNYLSLFYSDSTLQPSIFYDLNSNIAFHSNMQISKIPENPTGYFLGYKYDLFSNATKTNSGNFLILGTKQELIDGTTHPKVYKKDLLIIEVDENGKPIN